MGLAAGQARALLRTLNDPERDSANFTAIHGCRSEVASVSATGGNVGGFIGLKTSDGEHSFVDDSYSNNTWDRAKNPGLPSIGRYGDQVSVEKTGIQ